MQPRQQYIETVRNLYSMGAAIAQDDREGFVLLADNGDGNMDTYAVATVVAMRNPIVDVARREQIPVRTLLNDNGPLRDIPGAIRDALGRLHRDEDFDSDSLVEDLRLQIRNGDEPLPDEDILVLGALVDSVVAAWTLLVGASSVVDHARRLLLATGMLPDER